MNRILHSTLKRHQLGIKLFLLICLNLAIAPAIYAGKQGEISQAQAYAIGLLLLSAVVMSIYLFAVIFVPEKF